MELAILNPDAPGEATFGPVARCDVEDERPRFAEELAPHEGEVVPRGGQACPVRRRHRRETVGQVVDAGLADVPALVLVDQQFELGPAVPPESPEEVGVEHRSFVPVRAGRQLLDVGLHHRLKVAHSADQLRFGPVRRGDHALGGERCVGAGGLRTRGRRGREQEGRGKSGEDDKGDGRHCQLPSRPNGT